MSNINYSLRPATEADVPKLSQFVIAAESQGKGAAYASYARLFDLSPGQLEGLLCELLSDDTGDCELSWVNFIVISDTNGHSVGGCSAWIEPSGGLSSGAIKARLWHYALDAQRRELAARRLPLLAEIAIPRDANTLQLDCFCIEPAARGKGLIPQLIAAQRARFPAVDVAQIQLMNTNLAALKAYQKAGFTISKQTQSTNALIVEWLGGTGRLLLESKNR
jgi:GNAT superfamily N-acetyltransferase